MPKGQTYFTYLEAWRRLFTGERTPMTDIIAYYETLPVPHSLGVFIDVIRALESDHFKRVADDIKKKTHETAPSKK